MNAVADMRAARGRRDAGMASALQHAEDDAPGWAEQAHEHLTVFAAEQREPWTVEQLRSWAYDRGMTRPDEERAWGGVTRAAVRAGVIARAGFAPAASSNGSAKAVYVAVPAGGAR